MNLDITAIVNEKLAEMEQENVIRKRIETTLEKTVLDAVTEALSGWELRRRIQEQLTESVSALAADCGLPAYNGFITQKMAEIIQAQFTEDIAVKTQEALERLIVRKYDNIKLSDIFAQYREWVLEHTEESDKYERRFYHAELEEKEDGSFTNVICRFADHQLEEGYVRYAEEPEVELRFSWYKRKKTATIYVLRLDGRLMKDALRVGHLSDFEAFVLNLYYNKTEIIMDPENVDDNCAYDVDM